MGNLEQIIRIAVFDKTNIDALRNQANSLPPNIKIEYVPIQKSYGKDDQAELANLMKDFDGTVIRSDTKFQGALDQLPNLKVIGRAGVGVDNIDTTKASRNGTIVFYAPDSNSISVEEEVVFQIGELERKIGQQNARLKAGEPENSVKADSLGRQLYGKTLGVVGIGNVGGKVVSPALGLGMTSVLYDPLKTEEVILRTFSQELEKRGLILADKSRVKVGSLSDALGCDYVTVHVPLTDGTKGLIGREEIEQMKKGAVLINDSREGIVNENAVMEALNLGKLRAYITDVLIKNSPLLGHKGVIVTAHTGAKTEEAEDRAASMIGESISAYVQSDGKCILRSYNCPTIDNNLRDSYNLTRIIAAFATQYLNPDGKIKSIKVLASGLSSYNEVALSMAASAGIVFSLGKLNGNNDLPASSILKEMGITVSAEEIEGARLGVSSKIALEYELSSGNKKRFVGQIDTEEGEIKYTLKGIDDFMGRGTSLYPTQYILVEHPNSPGHIGIVATEIGKHEFNIDTEQVNLGSKARPDRNLLVCPVHREGEPSLHIPDSLLENVIAQIGVGLGRTIYIDLRQYKSPHAV